MKEPDYIAAIEFARRRMEHELPPELSYHNLAHTFDDVLPAALHLADLCNLNEDEKNLLAVAAAFHDFGWIKPGAKHEQISADIAREVLPSFGFSQEQIETIAGIIMATHMPHTPSNLLEEILVDADLDVLGRDDFWLRNEELRAEIMCNGDRISDAEWYAYQLKFLEEHQYFTDAARQLRDKCKKRHEAELMRRLSISQRQKTLGLTDHE